MDGLTIEKLNQSREAVIHVSNALGRLYEFLGKELYPEAHEALSGLVYWLSRTNEHGLDFVIWAARLSSHKSDAPFGCCSGPEVSYALDETTGNLDRTIEVGDVQYDSAYAALFSVAGKLVLHMSQRCASYRPWSAHLTRDDADAVKKWGDDEQSLIVRENYTTVEIIQGGPAARDALLDFPHIDVPRVYKLAYREIELLSRQLGSLREMIPPSEDQPEENARPECENLSERPAKLEDKPVAKSKTESVVLFGRHESPIVKGIEKATLTNSQYDVVLAILRHTGDKGLTKDALDRKSRHGDARKILKRLSKRDSDWASVISFPGTTGKGYRIL